MFSLAPVEVHDLSYANYAWRIGMMILVLAAWTQTGPKFEPRVVSWFLPWLGALALLAVLHHDVDAVWQVLLRNVILVAFGAAIAGSDSSGDRYSIARPFLLTVLYGCLALCCFAAAALIVQGWSWEIGRLAKGESLESGGLLFNTVLFVAAVGLAAVQPRRKSARIAAVSLFVGSSFLLATRTPLAALVLAGIIAVGVKALRSKFGLGQAGVLAVSALLLVVPLAGVWYVASNPSPEVARMLAGRVQLWQAGLLQWENNILAGDPRAGLHQTLDLTYNRLSFWESWQFERLYGLKSGGLHSVWVQNLAEFGLIGFTAVFVSYWRLLAVGLKRRSAAFFFLLLVLLSRSFVEYSGFFSQANSPLDMIALVALLHVFYCTSRPMQRSRGSLASPCQGSEPR